MGMKLRIVMVTPLALVSAGILPAADPQLLNLVMPDAKILAGINVDQAKATPFGQFVLAQAQAQNQQLQEMVTETGFDPTRDLHEILMASNGTQPHSGLALARGNFSPDRIDAAAQKAGGVSENYRGVTIVEDPKKESAFAFLSGSIAVGGDIAGVKAAIDRQTAPATLPAALLVQVNQLSTSEDAWGISEVPPPAFKTAPAAPNVPNIPPNLFQDIQQASGGVKFGSQVAITAQLQTGSAQNAASLAGVLQFLINLGQMQNQQNPQAAEALKSVTIAASGNQVNISANIPEADVEALLEHKPSPKAAPNGRRRLAR